MNSKTLLLLSFLVVILACNKLEKAKKQNQIDGLWLVKKVKMDSQEMTPIARWMRFNPDSTQTSGNGWLQHSVGTWSLNYANDLSVTNTNGIIDEAEPFKVMMQENQMTWKRKEDGMEVTVFLERTDKLPTSDANKLYGLWRFDSIIENDKNVTNLMNPANNAMLFLRWDNTYELRNYTRGKLYGVFKTHGHRPQIDLISYGKERKNQYYTFSLKGDKLLLNSTNSNKEIKLTRIHQFLK